MIASLSEEQLFDIKQKFLRTIPHPKLILKQILRIDKSFEFKHGDYSHSKTLSDELNEYESDLLRLKLDISNAKEASALSNSLKNLLQLQYQLIYKLSSYAPISELDQETDIKMSDPFETYELFKFLKANDITESEIKNYLCKELKSEIEGPFSILVTSVLRAKKITANE
ncbi:MAG: hypothetical protein ABJG68_14275 [Crocinitomicaceae bacterium]